MSKWFELDKRQKRYIHSKANSWIFVNMLKYGNCMIPNVLVTKYSIKELEDLMSYILESPVVIDELDLDYIGITYIAKFKNRGD